MGRAAPVAQDGESLVYTHKKFSISYNDNRIIQVNLTSENPVTLSAGDEPGCSKAAEFSGGR